MRRFLLVSGIVLEAIAFMSQVGPDEAVSNFSKWGALAHVTPPIWLTAPKADSLIGGTSAILGAIAIVAFFLTYFLPQSRRQSAIARQVVQKDDLSLSLGTRKALGIDLPYDDGVVGGRGIIPLIS